MIQPANPSPQQTSGVTLTLGIAYLTVLAHERNRVAQGSQLRTQSSLLNSLLLADPTLAYPESDAEARTRPSAVERAKEAWNDEVRGVVRWVQGADWEGVREGVEGAVGRVFGGGAGKATEVAEVEVARVREEAVGARLREGFDGARVAAERKAARILAATRETGEEKTEHGIENAGKTAEAAFRKGVETTAEVTQGLRVTGETAADAVKGAVQSGVKTVKKAVGKAGERQVDKDEGLTDVQRALRQRYQRSETAGSVKEALAQRYKKVD